MPIGYTSIPVETVRNSMGVGNGLSHRPSESRGHLHELWLLARQRLEVHEWRGGLGSVGLDEYVKALQFHGFVHWIAIDPTTDHLIVTPHFACEVSVNGLPKTPNCLLETKDAGATWKILEGSPTSTENGGPYMTDANTWYYSASADGLWRTGDAGVTWSHVYKGGYAGIGDLKLSNGKLYSGGVFNVISSSDNGLTWTAIPGSPVRQFTAGNTDTVFTARGVDYYTASVNDMTKWDHLRHRPFPKIPTPGT